MKERLIEVLKECIELLEDDYFNDKYDVIHEINRVIEE